MTIQNSKLAAAVIAFATMVGLTGCVTPQIQKSVEGTPGSTVQATTTTRTPNSPPAAIIQPRQAIQPTKPAAQGAGSANSTPAISTASATVTASKRLQGLLENNLTCPAKGVKLFPAAAIRELAINERIIGRKPITVDDEPDYYPVVGNLDVYGYKVTMLNLSDDGTVAAYINATSAELEKVYKSKKIRLKKEQGNPGLWGRLSYGYNLYLYESKGKMRMGCTVQWD